MKLEFVCDVIVVSSLQMNNDRRGNSLKMFDAHAWIYDYSEWAEFECAADGFWGFFEQLMCKFVDSVLKF